MKAAQINQYGDPSVIHIVDIPKPTAGEGQVLVEVHAASLNPFDTKIRSGALKDMIPLQFPITLGGDIAGIVTEVGADITAFAVGDKVYGGANAIGGNSGAFAEYAVTRADAIGKMPINLDFQQAASLVLVGVAACQAINQHIKLQAGQRILIHGGGGGIGAIAIQLAKHIGAYVATTASGDNIDYVKQLGADQVIDYKTENFAELLHDFDAVFDTVGGDVFEQSLDILKSGGIAVSMVSPPNEAKANERGVTAIFQNTETTTANLDELSRLVGADVITTRIGQTFPLDRASEAFAARESGKVDGKIVIHIH